MMITLRCTFLVLTYLGCLPPSTWSSIYKRIFYDLYSIVITILLRLLLLSTILDVVFNVENQDDFSDNLYLAVAMIIGNYKMIHFQAKRDAIIIMIKNVQKRPFSAKDEVEKNIKMKYQKIIEMNSMIYMFVLQLYLTVTLIASLCKDPKNRKLPYRGWLPYDYSSPILYSVTYCYQVLSVSTISFIHAAIDTLFSNLMLLIHYQLEILEYRLQNIKNDDKGSAKECAFHHKYIYEFAGKVNRSFQGVLCFQVVASVGMICFSLYRITQAGLGSRMYEMIMYTICTLMQLFYYSWYGNEVKLKSLDIPCMIIKSNWTNLDTGAKRILLIIMLRSTFPIEFSGAHIVSVNIDTFTTVLKTSYSAYNVMQQR